MVQKASVLRTLRDAVMMMLMAVLMALNYQVFILQNQFAPAGINGLATMVQYVFHFSVGYMSLLINIPLAVLCFFLVDKQFAAKTLLFSLTFSCVLLLLQNHVIDVQRFVYHTDDGRSTLLAPIASGVINGVIYGVTIRHGGSTGGTDFVAAFVHKKNPSYSMMHIIFVLNSVVAVLSYFVYNFNIEPVLLCIAYCFVTTQMSDRILKGGNGALKFELVTKYPDEISKAVISELHHSSTILNVKGGYTHDDKTMLICIVNKHQITGFLNILERYPDTFAVVSDVSSTVGNFKHIPRGRDDVKRH